MLNDFLDWILEHIMEISVVAFILLACGGIYYLVERDNRNWEAFKVQHKCVLVGHTDAHVGITSSGSSVTMPETNSYKCDDGVTYTR